MKGAWPWRRILGSAALSVFFVFACSLYIGFDGRTWVSPDETATALVAQEFATRGTLALYEPRNPELGGILGPRSMVAVGQSLLPIGFLGIAAIAAAFRTVLGAGGLMLVGPTFGALGIAAMFVIVHRLSRNARWAAFSAAALALHPGYFFYSARSLMPNVPFTSLLLMSAATAVFTGGATLTGGVASGALLGLALTVRLFEAPWVLLGAAASLFVGRRVVTRRFVAGFVVGGLCVLAALLWAQHGVYGDILKTGYTTSATIDPSLVPPSAPGRSSAIAALLLPFGFHEYNILVNVWNYGFVLYPWMTLVAVTGIAVALYDIRRRALSRAWLLPLGAFVIVGAWLAVVYGSGKIADNPDPRALTLANSYVRYWLPLIALTAPFAGYAAERGYRALASINRRAAVTAVACCGLTMTILLVWRVTAGPDGIGTTRQVLMAGERKRATIAAQTEERAIVIVDRSDKFVYPTRSVVTPLLDPTTLAALPRLQAAAPVYYLGLPLPERDLTHLNTVLLQGTGLRFVPQMMVEDEMLYVLEK